MAPAILVVTLLLVVTGCSLIFGGPRFTVKKFMEAAQAGDVEGMRPAVFQ
jgi:hypothetical protein